MSQGQEGEERRGQGRYHGQGREQDHQLQTHQLPGHLPGIRDHGGD